MIGGGVLSQILPMQSLFPITENILTIAEIESNVLRLAEAISKTQKRTNALNNIMIPRLSENIKFISDALDEKDREDFSRLKVIKSSKEEQ